MFISRVLIWKFCNYYVDLLPLQRTESYSHTNLLPFLPFLLYLVSPTSQLQAPTMSSTDLSIAIVLTPVLSSLSVLFMLIAFYQIRSIRHKARLASEEDGNKNTAGVETVILRETEIHGEPQYPLPVKAN